MYITHRNVSSTSHKESCDTITTPVGSQLLPSSEDTTLMQQLLMEQQKQQTLLLNQQELLMGLQEGHKELMEKVQHREPGVDHSSEREWWIKKLLQQSSEPTTQQKNNNNSLRSQSFPNLGNSSQRHLVSYTETSIFSNTTIGMQQNKEKSPLNKALSFKEATDEEIVPESPGVLAQASVAVEACSYTSPTHSPTYQSCGTNTHNLVDAGVNTAPLTVDICIGTEWALSSSSSDEESEVQSKTETSPQTVDSSDTSPPAKEQQHTPAATTVKEPQNEDSVDVPDQPKGITATTTSSTGNSSYIELINQEVLARSTDGYYYWGMVLQYDPQQDVYIVEDLDSRQQLMMARSDFITETQDAARAVLQIYDRALAPRVLSPNCFLPGGYAPYNLNV